MALMTLATIINFQVTEKKVSFRGLKQNLPNNINLHTNKGFINLQ